MTDELKPCPFCGAREPSGALLEWLGFERVVAYRRKRA